MESRQMNILPRLLTSARLRNGTEIAPEREREREISNSESVGSGARHILLTREFRLKHV